MKAWCDSLLGELQKSRNLEVNSRRASVSVFERIIATSVITYKSDIFINKKAKICKAKIDNIKIFQPLTSKKVFSSGCFDHSNQQEVWAAY
jgi:hypothetical protein